MKLNFFLPQFLCLPFRWWFFVPLSNDFQVQWMKINNWKKTRGRVMKSANTSRVSITFLHLPCRQLFVGSFQPPWSSVSPLSTVLIIFHLSVKLWIFRFPALLMSNIFQSQTFLARWKIKGNFWFDYDRCKCGKEKCCRLVAKVNKLLRWRLVEVKGKICTKAWCFNLSA